GVTALAQELGRDDLTDDRKEAYEHYFLTYQSMMLDMYIIYKTIKNIATSEGVHQ
ncbi:capsular biosynthesis protein, partial [Staphylococcus aureus]